MEVRVVLRRPVRELRARAVVVPVVELARAAVALHVLERRQRRATAARTSSRSEMRPRRSRGDRAPHVRADVRRRRLHARRAVGVEDVGRQAGTRVGHGDERSPGALGVRRAAPATTSCRGGCGGDEDEQRDDAARTRIRMSERLPGVVRAPNRRGLRRRTLRAERSCRRASNHREDGHGSKGSFEPRSVPRCSRWAFGAGGGGRGQAIGRPGRVAAGAASAGPRDRAARRRAAAQDDARREAPAADAALRRADEGPPRRRGKPASAGCSARPTRR